MRRTYFFRLNSLQILKKNELLNAANCKLQLYRSDKQRAIEITERKVFNSLRVVYVKLINYTMTITSVPHIMLSITDSFLKYFIIFYLLCYADFWLKILHQKWRFTMLP